MEKERMNESLVFSFFLAGSGGHLETSHDFLKKKRKKKNIMDLSKPQYFTFTTAVSFEQTRSA